MVAHPHFADLDVIVVGADPLARHGLTLLLDGEPGLVVTAALAPRDAANAPTAGITAWDVGHDARGGLERYRDARDVVPPALLLADPETTHTALAFGARGVLPRDADGARIGAALRAVAAGNLVVDPAFAATLAPTRAAEPLSPREQEVLRLLAEGLPNKLIADRLHISVHTAKFHVDAVLQKLGAQSRTEAVVRAAKLGWVAL